MEVKTNLYNALYYHNASVFFYRGVMIILLLLILGCSDSNKVAKETNVSIDVINKVGFKSVFAKNGIFVKLVPAEDNSYSLQVSITNYIDTLDYYLNSKTKQQSVPKILFGTDPKISRLIILQESKSLDNNKLSNACICQKIHLP